MPTPAAEPRSTPQAICRSFAGALNRPLSNLTLPQGRFCTPLPALSKDENPAGLRCLAEEGYVRSGDLIIPIEWASNWAIRRRRGGT